MKHRDLKPRFAEVYFSKIGRNFFYRIIGKKNTEILESPHINWEISVFPKDISDISAYLVKQGWQKHTFEQFQDKFKNLPFFLDNEQKREYLKQLKIKRYLINKQKIMNGGYDIRLR